LEEKERSAAQQMLGDWRGKMLSRLRMCRSHQRDVLTLESMRSLFFPDLRAALMCCRVFFGRARDDGCEFIIGVIVR
jgi:hypothetical protein